MPPLSLLIKPASAACNLNCDYCFYKDIGRNREVANRGMMSLETLEILVQKAFASAEDSCTFAFQGGEPTLAGLPFFEKVVELQKKYNKKRIQVQNVLQTNGILLSRDWAEFLANNHFLVGLSLDGRESLHDTHRGAGTHARVLEAAKLLTEFRVEFNVLAVVTQESAAHVRETYRFFLDNGLNWLQFIPCLDPLEEPGTRCLSVKGYGKFLKILFDLWYRDITAGKFVYIQYFENLVGLLRGCPSGSCSGNGFCSVQNVVEADGSVYPCDFYALDEWKLGNIRQSDFEEFRSCDLSRKFRTRSLNIPESCKVCPYRAICRGGCRRDYIGPAGGEQNRYCEAYKDFFSYVLPRLQRLAFP